MDQGPGLNIFGLVEFLKKKGCAEHEIDEYFRKAISANTAQLQITDCEFSSDLFHRVYDKLDALVHEENIVDEQVLQNAAQEVVHEAADDDEDEASHVEKAKQALTQQLDDDQHKMLNHNLVKWFNRFFTKVLTGDKVVIYEYTYNDRGEKLQAVQRTKHYLKDAFSDCKVRNKRKEEHIVDFWFGHKSIKKMKHTEAVDEKVQIEPIFELLSKTVMTEDDGELSKLYVFTHVCAHEMGFIATDWQEGENNYKGYKFISATKFYKGYCKWAEDNDKHVSCASASDLGTFLQGQCKSVYGIAPGRKASKAYCTINNTRCICIPNSKENMQKMFEQNDIPGFSAKEEGGESEREAYFDSDHSDPSPITPDKTEKDRGVAGHVSLKSLLVDLLKDKGIPMTHLQLLDEIQAQELYEFGQSKTPDQTVLARLNDLHKKESSGIRRVEPNTFKYVGHAPTDPAA